MTYIEHLTILLAGMGIPLVPAPRPGVGVFNRIICWAKPDSPESKILGDMLFTAAVYVTDLRKRETNVRVYLEPVVRRAKDGHEEVGVLFGFCVDEPPVHRQPSRPKPGFRPRGH